MEIFYLGVLLSKTCGFIEFPNHTHKKQRQPCGATLMKRVVKCNEKHESFYPVKVYSYRSVIRSFRDLLGKPGILEMLRVRRPPNNDIMADIVDGALLREFKYIDGSTYFTDVRNIAFMMNFDFFDPFEGSKYSLGVLYLALINLPREIRFLWKNVIIVGIIPGPEEPKNDINSFLKPMVDELLVAWNGIYLEEEHGIQFLYKFALLCISNDIPATRKCGGFLGHMARKGIYCLRPPFKTSWHPACRCRIYSFLAYAVFGN